MVPLRSMMIRLLLYAAAVAPAGASTAMIHDTPGTLSAMFGKDFCFVEDHVWTPTGEDKHVILYDSCILRITVDMTGKIDDTIGDTNLGVEKDGCTVRYHPDGQGHGWVYRGAMKWEAVLIPYKNAVHVSVIGHRDNACTLEFMPTSGEPMECPKDMCPKRFFPIAQGTTGKNDKRCCEECTAGVCHRGFRLKESLDKYFNKEDECCEKLAVAFEDVKDCKADEYRRDISETANGTFCKKCPTPCPRGQEPNLKKAKKQKVDECCVACEKCEENQYAADDGTTCCKECACGDGEFVNKAIKAKTSEKQCCQACPATCPSGQTSITGKPIKMLSDCCKECPKCSSEGKEYVTGDGECCKACVCEAGQYFKTMPAANKDACCGACPKTCPSGKTRTQASKDGAVDSMDKCCEAISIKCADAKCGAYLYNDKDDTSGQCCKACDIKDCGTWQALNPTPANKDDCCKALTTAEFCAADQFACPSSMYPKPKHSKVPETKEKTAATHKNTSLTPEKAEVMTGADAAAGKQAFCCEACTCKDNQVKKPFPTVSSECCEDCGTCSSRQYMVKATTPTGHKDQKSCCAACGCTAGQYYKEPDAGKVYYPHKDACCGDCTCDETWQKRTTAEGPFDSKDKCCVAKTWSEYCKKDMCSAEAGKFPKSEYPPGNVGISDNAEKKQNIKNEIDSFKYGILLENVAIDSCCEGFEAYCGKEENKCKPSQYKIQHMGEDGGTPQCCKDCVKCAKWQKKTEAKKGGFTSKDQCCTAQTAKEYCGEVKCEGKVKHIKEESLQEQMEALSIDDSSLPQKICCMDAHTYCKEKGCTAGHYLKAAEDLQINDGQVTECCEACECRDWEKMSDGAKKGPVDGTGACCEAKTCADALEGKECGTTRKEQKVFNEKTQEMESQTVEVPKQRIPNARVDESGTEKSCCRENPLAKDTNFKYVAVDKQWALTDLAVQAIQFETCGITKDIDNNVTKDKDNNGISKEKKSIMICSRTGEGDLYPLDAADTYQKKNPKKDPKKDLEKYLAGRTPENQYSRLTKTGVGKIKELARALQEHGLTVKSAEIQGPFLAKTQDNSLNSKYYWGLGAARAAIVAWELKEQLKSAGVKDALQGVYEAAKGCRKVFQPDSSGKKPKIIKSTSITRESSASQDECPKGNEKEKECCEYTRRDKGFKEVWRGRYDKDNNKVMEIEKKPIEVVMGFTLEDAEKK